MIILRMFFAPFGECLCTRNAPLKKQFLCSVSVRGRKRAAAAAPQCSPTVEALLPPAVGDRGTTDRALRARWGLRCWAGGPMHST